jgi:GDP-D-mannose 3', 5'-epimerase
MTVLVCGAGGFIGGHLVKRLINEGYEVRAVDIKSRDKWHQWHEEADNWDDWNLKSSHQADFSCLDMDEVYNLAADMGGMGFIETHKYDCMQSVLINTNMLNAALVAGVSKYFFASSACVYPGYRQNSDWDAVVQPGLAESDAYPADPEDGYGWEKLFSERMCRHAYEDRGLKVRIGRYHNVYGPHGTWEGGREKAPAALCRKIAECAISGTTELDIWGDGKQMRSFIYIDDCIEGTRKLMERSWIAPLNIGSSELVSINGLADKIENIARWSSGYELPMLDRAHDLSAPQGVRGRNSDNALIKQVLHWEPSITLDDGLQPTYKWIYEQVLARKRT